MQQVITGKAPVLMTLFGALTIMFGFRPRRSTAYQDTQ
jgi:hypothetical protein